MDSDGVYVMLQLRTLGLHCVTCDMTSKCLTPRKVRAIFLMCVTWAALGRRGRKLSLSFSLLQFCEVGMLMSLSSSDDVRSLSDVLIILWYSDLRLVVMRPRRLLLFFALLVGVLSRSFAIGGF